MEGLAHIRPIFASHLKAIRLCTQHIDKVGKIDCSDVANKDRLSRLRNLLFETKDWSREMFEDKLVWMKDDVMSHNQNTEEQQELFMTGSPLKSLLRALQTLMACHNNSVTLGTHDLDWRFVQSFEMGLHRLGIEPARVIHDASSTLQILASAVRMSCYPLKAIDIRLFDGNLKPCNIEPRDIFWAQLSSFTELTVQQLLSYSKEYLFPSPIKSRISVIQSDGWHLEMGDHCFLPDGNNWICFCSSTFDRANYGALYDYIRSKDFKSVVLEGIEGSVNFLKSDLNLRTDSLERLELLSVFVGETQINTAMQAPSLKFLTYLQSLRRLQTLILEEVEDVSISDLPYHIQRERVEWNGYAEIQEGLKDLIAKAEAHYS